MLRGMRKMLDKHQKALLVLLAVFLMAVFTIPFGKMGGRPEHPWGTLYGTELTLDALRHFYSRWTNLGLPFVNNDPEATYLLLVAARDRGIRVGKGAVEAMLHRYPPQLQKIEYLIADPDRIARDIEPTDAQLRTYYKEEWTDTAKPFAEVKDQIREAVKDRLAKRAARRRMQAALERIAKEPREGTPWRNALRTAGAKHQLLHGISDFFSAEDAAGPLELLRAKRLHPLAADGGNARLPADLPGALFASQPGVPSAQPLRSGDKLFLFRTIATHAGFAPDGTLFAEDCGWRNGRFMITRHYPTYRELVKEKRRMEVAEVNRTFEEYLTVSKFVTLTCGGAEDRSLLTRDTRKQLLAVEADEVRALIAELPVQRFRADKAPDHETLLSFYNARKNRPMNPLSPDYGYYQPARVKVEYVMADAAKFLDEVKDEVREADAVQYYQKHRSTEFLDPATNQPKPYPLVRREILKELRLARAGARVTRRLETLKQTKAQTAQGEELPLEPAAAAAGFTHGETELFAQFEAALLAPELAGAEQFVEIAFQRSMRPGDIYLRPDKKVFFRPLSPILKTRTGNKYFFFRLREFQGERPLEFDQLDERQKAGVRSDCARYLALENAKKRVRELRTGIARELLRTLAEENTWSVKSGVVQSGEATSAVPPELAEVVRRQFGHEPGEIVRLVKGADAHYTAVTTQTDRQKGETHIEYVAFQPDQLAAELRPADEAIRERARQLCDDEFKKAHPDPKNAEDAEKPEPTEKHEEQARRRLVEVWKKKPFRDRYHEYLYQRLADRFRTYLDDHPLKENITKKVDTGSTQGFFHVDDAYPLRGDKALIQAAFQLKPATLTGPVGGDDHAAVLLLADEQVRDERKIEFVTVLTDRYDPLVVTVSDPEAEAYYKAHKEAFREPDRVRAEFLLGSVETIAEALAPAVTDAAIETHYKQRRTLVYKDQPLDAELKAAIRRTLAKEKAKQEARDAILAAHVLAQQSAEPLAKIAEMLPPKTKLIAGRTPMLCADDKDLPQIGAAPDLVKKLLAAKKNVLAPPTQTGDNWVLFRVTDRTPAHIPEFQKILPAARGTARRHRLEEKATAALDKARAGLAKEKGLSLEAAVQRPEIAADLPFRPNVVTTGFLDFNRAIDYPYMSATLRKAAFAAPDGGPTPVLKTNEGIQLARVVAVKKKNRSVKVHYVLVPAADLAPTVEVTEADARKHYQDHPKQYERPRLYDVEYLAADTTMLADGIKPDEKELQDAYQQLQDTFQDDLLSRPGHPEYKPFERVRKEVTAAVRTRGAKKKALELARRARTLATGDKAKSFRTVAAELEGVERAFAARFNPDESGSPWALRGVSGLEAFLAAAKPGDTSRVLLGSSGPVIVRVTALRAPRTKPFHEVRRDARQNAARAHGLEKAKAWAQKICDRTRELMKAEKLEQPNAELLNKAAGELPVQTRQVTPITVDGTDYQNRRLAVLYYQQALYRSSPRLEHTAAQLHLFRLRRGQLSPAITLGDKARLCFLATLTGVRQGYPGDEALVADSGARQASAERIQNLINLIRKDFVPAPRPSS